MVSDLFPDEIPNVIDGDECAAEAREWAEKRNPATGERLCALARSRAVDIAKAVHGAKRAQRDWGEMPGVRRGQVLWDFALALRAKREWIARIVALETGKSVKSALGETDGAIQLATFFAGEGQRLYGRTTTSGMPHRSVLTMRCPLGVAGLIVAANTPIANVAWKAFPALVCGNAAVLKPPEDAPATAWAFARCAQEAGLPPGLFQVVQGLGGEAGVALVAHPDVAVISFTGSTVVGRQISVTVGERLGRLSLELGGKNAFVVCDDAALDSALNWAALSAFSNAGQRCAAGSRIIVFDAIYETFRERFVAAAKRQRVGTSDDDDFGPVINERQMTHMVDAVRGAVAQGATLLTGGERLRAPPWTHGYFMPATVLEAKPTDEISRREVFGPITCLYRARNFKHAVELANDSPYGLTAAIHTGSLDRALQFVQQSQTGVVTVNAGTFGSEPHMPFGGMRASGNGTREPGTEALDVYSSLKDVYLSAEPTHV